MQRKLWRNSCLYSYYKELLFLCCFKNYRHWKKHFNSLSTNAVANKSFECVWPFSGVHDERVKLTQGWNMMKMNCFSEIIEWIIFVIFRGPRYRRSPTRCNLDLNLRKTWIQALLNEVVMGIANCIYIHHSSEAKPI